MVLNARGSKTTPAILLYLTHSLGWGYMISGLASPPLTWHQKRIVMNTPSFGQNYEEIEFIIHTDGRIEERVRGVKGVNCEQVTERINKELGEVYESKPTEEMFEQPVTVDNELELKQDAGWRSSEWGGETNGASDGW